MNGNFNRIKGVTVDATPFRIFVVDDDSLARLVIANQFAGSDYQVACFASGEECLAALESSPDLVLLDIDMPGMDGISVCSAIREEGNETGFRCCSFPSTMSWRRA